MTADDARVLVGEIRDAARRALRAISRPRPDWAEARMAAEDMFWAADALWSACEEQEYREGEVDGMCDR